MVALKLRRNLELQFLNAPLAVRSHCAPGLLNSTIGLRSLMTAPRLIHISDLHFFDPNSSSTISGGLSSRDNDSVARSDTLTKFLVADSELLARPGQKPMLIITGDLTDSGDIEDYEFAKQFITNLMSKGFDVYVTPGNHDYCKYGLLCLTDLPLTDSPEERRDRFVAEIESVESGSVTAAGLPPHEYPKYADYDYGRLILLDSMQDELDDRDAPRRRGGQGRLGTLQLNALKVLIGAYQQERRRGKKIAVCLHHAPLQCYNNDPMWPGILEDHALLMSYLSGVNGQSVIDCLLFGHTGDLNRGYPSDEKSSLIPLINSENLEDVGDDSGPEVYPVTVLDLGTYQRLVFSTSSPTAPIQQSWGNPVP